MARKHSKTARASKSKRPSAESGALRPNRLTDAVTLALIFFLILVAYFPSLPGQTLWNNSGETVIPLTESERGIPGIWSNTDASQQYDPLLRSALLLQYRLWGGSAQGYHLVSILLHTLSAGLVVLIMRRLKLPGAWAAGLIFALHPVCTEAVGMISGQGTILSGFFFLAAGLVYLHFDEKRSKALYGWTIALFLLALLSKAVALTLPLALVVVLWWKYGRIQLKRDLSPIIPFFAIGAAGAFFNAWVEKSYMAAEAIDVELGLLQRILLGGRAVWAYMARTVWPVDLNFIYPRWNLDPSIWWLYLFPVSLLALAAVLWKFRHHRGPLAGFLFLLATLSPVLGFFRTSRFMYSHTADQFQYIACLGVIIPAVAGLLVLSDTGRLAWLTPSDRRLRFLKTAVPAVAILALFVVTRSQAGVYANAETLWRTTIARNPDAYIAHNNLGEILFRQERVDEAMEHCRKAVQLNPANPYANANLANTLRYKERFDEAIIYYRKAVELRPGLSAFHSSLANTLIETRDIEEAVVHFDKALQLDQSDPFLLNNFAWILATCPNDSIRKGERAVELARKAVQISAEKDLNILGTLAAALAEVGRFDEAVKTELKAYDMALAAGDAELIRWHSELLSYYRAGLPHRERTLTPR